MHKKYFDDKLTPQQYRERKEQKKKELHFRRKDR